MVLLCEYSSFSEQLCIPRAHCLHGAFASDQIDEPSPVLYSLFSP